MTAVPKITPFLMFTGKSCDPSGSGGVADLTTPIHVLPPTPRGPRE